MDKDDGLLVAIFLIALPCVLWYLLGWLIGLAVIGVEVALVLLVDKISQQANKERRRRPSPSDYSHHEYDSYGPVNQ